MIDNEDMPTLPRPTQPDAQQHGDSPATIQIPADQQPITPPDQHSGGTTPDGQHTTSAPDHHSDVTTANGQTGTTSTPDVQESAPVSSAPSTSSAPLPTQNEKASVQPVPFLDVADLLTLRVASDPQISPDGTLIAFTLQENDSEKNTTKSTIWLVSSTGGKTQPPWQITGGEAHDYAPRWSPNGQALTFLSDRSGTPQIYLLPLQGGEARQITTLAQGVSEYSWRPDGSLLLAHSAWKPSDNTTVSDTNTDAIIITRLDHYWDGVGYKQGRHQQLWLIPLEGSAIRLTSEPVDLEQSCWSPDGSEIVFCANRRSDPDLTVSRALWVLTISTGKMRRLTPEEGLAQVPSWSPDGQSIAYLYTPDQTEAGNMSPWIVKAQGDEQPRPAVQNAEQLTCQTWIIDELRSEFLQPPQWYPDSQALLVPVQERGQVHLYRLDCAQNSSTRLTAGNGRSLSPQLSKNGKTIALVRADWFTPGDIWSMDSDGKNLRKLSRVNDTFLQSRQLIRPKRVTWQGADGLEIEGFLYLPPLPEHSKAPLLLAPHGGPSLAWGDAYAHEFQVLAGRGYAVLAPNPRGSAGYGDEFGRKVLQDWGGDDFHDLMAGLDSVLATEPVDETRLGIGGISYGGYMTLWAITQTHRFKAAVSRNGISSLPSASLLSDQTIWFNLSMTDETLQRERSALSHVNEITTPLLLLHAEEDQRCPLNESLQLFVALRKRKQIVELVRYPGVSHLMDWPGVGTPRQRVDRLRRTVEWFEHFV